MDKLLTYAMDNWQQIAVWTSVLLGGGGSIALLVQIIKKWRHLEEAKKLLFLLPGFFSFIFTAADSILANGTVFVQWFPQAAQLMPVVMVVAMAIHRFALSDLWKRMEAFMADVKAYRLEKYNQPLPDKTIDEITASLNAAQPQPDVPKLAE